MSVCSSMGVFPQQRKGGCITNCVRPASHSRWPCLERTIRGAGESLRQGGSAVVVRCACVTSYIPSVGLTRPVRPRFGMS
jgi:hypothetical protein